MWKQQTVPGSGRAPSVAFLPCLLAQGVLEAAPARRLDRCGGFAGSARLGRCGFLPLAGAIGLAFFDHCELFVGQDGLNAGAVLFAESLDLGLLVFAQAELLA